MLWDVKFTFTPPEWGSPWDRALVEAPTKNEAKSTVVKFLDDKKNEMEARERECPGPGRLCSAYRIKEPTRHKSLKPGIIDIDWAPSDR